MAKRPALAFLTDVNVPDSVGDLIVQQGHQIVRVRDIMAADAADPVVAAAAMESGLILVSWDKDFNHQRFMKDRFDALCRIGFSCPEPDGAVRLEQVIDVIEFAFVRANGKAVRIRIGGDKVQINC